MSCSYFFLLIVTILISDSLASNVHKIDKIVFKRPEYLDIDPADAQAIAKMKEVLAAEIFEGEKRDFNSGFYGKKLVIEGIKIEHLEVNNIDYGEATAGKTDGKNSDEYNIFHSSTKLQIEADVDNPADMNWILSEIKKMTAQKTQASSQPIFTNTVNESTNTETGNTVIRNTNLPSNNVPFVMGEGFSFAYPPSPLVIKRKVVTETYGGDLPNVMILENVDCSFSTSKARVDGVLVDIKDIKLGSSIIQGKWKLKNDKGVLKITGPYGARGKPPRWEDDTVILDSY
jgi:hypothetical protein